MKQRITYILPSGTALTKSDIAIRGDTLHFSKASQAAEEWKVTLALDELSNKVSLQTAPIWSDEAALIRLCSFDTFWKTATNFISVGVDLPPTFLFRHCWVHCHQDSISSLRLGTAWRVPMSLCAPC